MKLNKGYIAAHLASLRKQPVVNAKLIRKWERLLRRAEQASSN